MKIRHMFLSGTMVMSVIAVGASDCSSQPPTSHLRILRLQEAVDQAVASGRLEPSQWCNCYRVAFAKSLLLVGDLIFFPPVEMPTSLVPIIPSLIGLYKTGPIAYAAYLRARLQLIDFGENVRSLETLISQDKTRYPVGRNILGWFFNEGEAQLHWSLMNEALNSSSSKLENQELGVTGFVLNYETWKPQILALQKSSGSKNRRRL